MKTNSQLKFTLLALLALSLGCEKEIGADLSGTIVENGPVEANIRVSALALDDIPDIAKELDALAGKQLFLRNAPKGANGTHFDTERVLKVVDSLGNTTYALHFGLEGAPENEFHNLVIGVDPKGRMAVPYIIRYVSEGADYGRFKDSGYDFTQFKGSANLHAFSDYFPDGIDGKVETCPTRHDANGDPIPCDVVPVSLGGTSGGGTTVGGAPSGTTSGTGSGIVWSNTLSVTITHTLPNGQTGPNGQGSYTYTPGSSTCQHNGACTVTITIDKSKGNQQKAAVAAKDPCADCYSSGTVGVNVPARTVNLVARFRSVLGLSDTEAPFLMLRPNLAEQINTFLDLNLSTVQSKDYAKLVIRANVANDFSRVLSLSLFTQDPYKVWGSLTQKEKDLIISFPMEAYNIYSNRPIAENATFAKFGKNGLNDKSDAFRYAYFNALNARKVGAFNAKLFSDAHESEVPLPLLKEKEMDLFNNKVGHSFANGFPGIDDINLANEVFKRIIDGSLRYLNPINFTLSPPYDINHDKVQDCPSCANGIILTTKLTPTNL